jgi:hypothetical protein
MFFGVMKSLYLDIGAKIKTTLFTMYYGGE